MYAIPKWNEKKTDGRKTFVCFDKKKETSNFYDNERQQYIYGNMGSSCI